MTCANQINILGVNVSAVSMADTIKTIDKWILQHEKHYVCVTGVHGIMESQSDKRLREIHNKAGLVTADGMPLVWISKLKGFRNIERGYGPDLMLKIMERSMQKNYTHFFYGSGPQVPELLVKAFTKKFPGIKIVGTFSPPYRPLTSEEDGEIVRKINSCNPDIVWVGISTPRQEYWMAEHINQLSATVLIGVGAAFDFHAGLKKQAPHWMQISGLEWLFRLLKEPKRLWKRYLYNNPRFLWKITRQLWDERNKSN